MRKFLLVHTRYLRETGKCRALACLLLLLALCGPRLLWAEVGSPLVKLVADNGQIQNGIVTALAQDRQGFVWIGTQYGLLRYDGYHFRRFSVHPISKNAPGTIFVRHLWVAPDGRLWVGTNSDGAAVFDPRTERFTLFTPAPGTPGRLASGRVDAFAADGRGGVWIGSDDGLYHWSSGETTLDRRDATTGQAGALGDSHVRSLLLDTHKTLWVGTWDGLARLPFDSPHFERVGETDAGKEVLARQEIWALIEDAAGRVWWGSRTLGAGWIDPANGRIHVLPLGTPEGIGYPWAASFALDHDGGLWIGTYGGGIDVVDPDTQRVIRRFRHQASVDTTLASNTIGALLADRSGLMWIGNWGGGLDQVNTRNHAFRMLRHVPGDPRSLSDDDVFSLLPIDNRRVWVGTDGNGIDILDLQTGVVGGIRPDPGNPHGLPDGHVIALARSGDGTIWVGTRQAGLLSYDPATRRFTRWPTMEGSAHAQVQRLLIAADGHLWIGTNGGLLELDPQTGKARSFSTREAPDVAFTRSVNTLAITPDGTLWAGTGNGLYALPPGQDQLVTILHDPGRKDSLSRDSVNGLVVDKTGRLWVATAGGIDGLKSWDGRIARFESLNARLGKPPGPLTSNLTMDDRGRLWDVGAVIDLATNGITELTSSEGFDIGGGWIGAYARMEDGHLLFGGPQGLLVVQPDAFMPWDFQPPVVISSLLIDGEPRPAAGVDQLTLSPKIRGFSVEFAALDFSDPDSLQYAYRLDGFDPDWTEAPVERRVATFTNLDPGQYTLRVKATNRLGEWSQKQLALVVTAEPAFYETLWFRTLIVLLILLGLYAIYLVRIRQLAARSRHLESVVRERTASLALANAELAELARTDVLTQLANRRAFLEEATAEVHRMHRSGRPFSIVLGDIDLFKSINDRHGHSAGDTVLVTVASVFRQQIRTQDTVARWGGEEMIFLLPETDLESAHCAAEKWREAVEAAKVTSGDATLRVTMTFGVSQIQQGEVIGRCIQRADAALYAGKNSGRNKVVSAAMEG